MANQQIEWVEDLVTGTFVEIDTSICQEILDFYEGECAMVNENGLTVIGEKDIEDYMYYTYDDDGKYTRHPEINDKYIRALTNYMRKIAAVEPDYIYEMHLTIPDSDTLEYFLMYPDLTGDKDYEHFPGWRV